MEIGNHDFWIMVCDRAIGFIVGCVVGYLIKILGV